MRVSRKGGGEKERPAAITLCLEEASKGWEEREKGREATKKTLGLGLLRNGFQTSAPPPQSQQGDNQYKNSLDPQPDPPGFCGEKTSLLLKRLYC